MEKKVKISNICIKETGIAYKSQDFAERNIGTPVVLLRDFDHPTYTEKDLINLSNYQKHVWVNRGDILISKTADIKLCLWEGERSVLNQNAMKLSLTSGDNVDKKYLLYFLANNLEHIKRRLAGATIRFVREGEIMNIEIPLPPLTEQKRIVEILEKADALRKKRREADESIKNIFSSFFIELFGDPELNPKKWPIIPFKEVTHAIFKGVFDLKASSYQAKGIPFLRISNIQNYTIDLAGAVYISEEAHEKEKKSELVPGDIIFSKVGTIDRIAIIPTWIKKCNISQNNVGARLKKGMVIPEYALGYLTSRFVINKIKQSSKRVLQDKLVLSDLRKLPFMLPPISEQQKFAALVQKAERIKEAQRESKQELESLFGAIMQKAFSG